MRRVCLAARVLSGAALVTVAWAGDAARADFPTLQVEVVSSGELVSPIGMATAGDGSGRLFVVDQRGRIEILKDGVVSETPFLDLEPLLTPPRTNTSGQPAFDERGLLGLAFHPDYGKAGTSGEGRFYVYYSAPTSVTGFDHLDVLAEYRVSAGNPNLADPSSGRILLTNVHPQFNHNAGQLAFGPDRMLYLSIGDGGSGGDNAAGHTGGSDARPNGVLGNAQDKTKLMGKILRIDVAGNNAPGGQYGIPADNPFVGEGGGVREEIWAYGLRNTWRFSFDDGPGGTGRLFAADVGQGNYEEVNIIEKGGNYGWRIREGLHAFDPTAPDPGVPLIDPISEYSHAEVGLSVTGGYVYRGSAIPELEGKYVFADWSNTFAPGNGTLLGLEEVSPGEWQRTVLDVEGGNPIGLYITAMGRDEAGELYVIAKSATLPGVDPVTGQPTGVIYRIVPEPGSALTLLAAGALGLMRQRRR